MNPILWVENAQKTMQAYEQMCKPLCAELSIPQTSFDILMFIANNPARNTAKDIVALKGLKANLVSINVDKLAREGYLQRVADEQDRRKTHLFCTEKAMPIIERGHGVQTEFYTRMFKDVTPESIEIMKSAMQTIFSNIDAMWRKNK